MLESNTQNTRRHHWRRIWLNFHLYLGLSIGLIFVLAGLTGSLLVFYVEIDEYLNPELRINADITQQPKQPYEAWLQALNHAHPERTGAWRIELPRHDQAMAVARYYKPEETKHLHFAPYMVWINPYTAQVVSSRFWGQSVMTWLYDLHYTLLLDKTGKIIMGIIGGILLILLFTGVYLWLPAHNKWRTALTFKRHSSLARLIFDVHKLNGIYGLGLLLLLVLTGILLELPDTFNPMINYVSPLYAMPKVVSKPQQKPRISVDKAVNIALQYTPQAQLRWIETPSNTTGSYRIMLYQTGEPSQRFPKTMVWIEQYTGRVLAYKDAKQSDAGDTFIAWLHPLHSGEIAGLTGRWLIFITGFIPAILYVTGFVRWQQKIAVKTKQVVY
jgi:uncharacterized iron-regulated membrane protein